MQITNLAAANKQISFWGNGLQPIACSNSGNQKAGRHKLSPNRALTCARLTYCSICATLESAYLSCTYDSAAVEADQSWHRLVGLGLSIDLVHCRSTWSRLSPTHAHAHAHYTTLTTHFICASRISTRTYYVYRCAVQVHAQTPFPPFSLVFPCVVNANATAASTSTVQYADTVKVMELLNGPKMPMLHFFFNIN